MQRLSQFLSYEAQIFLHITQGIVNKIKYYIFYILATFQIKNNFHTTDTTKIEN